MKASLLDVSVLVALFWSSHASHHKAQEWFERHDRASWATCPVTESAFVRIVSNPSFSKSSTTVQEATELLAENLDHPEHQYWPADVDYFTAIKPIADRIVGHQQVSDAYLLGLAIHHGGSLVTMDRGILELLPAKMQRGGLVTLL
jgi:toxin-antitoxin system PIN domain toxin